MAVLRDYKCKEHGYFEAWEPLCPKGCTENIKKVILQAPRLMSDKTKKNDKTLKNLADDFGMTNIKSTKPGENQAGYFTRNNKRKSPPVESTTLAPPREPRPGDAVLWGGGGRFNMQSALAGQVTRPVRDEAVGFNPKAAGNLTGPKAASYMNDHENLQIKK